jgi:hypothetical protein
MYERRLHNKNKHEQTQNQKNKQEQTTLGRKAKAIKREHRLPSYKPTTYNRENHNMSDVNVDFSDHDASSSLFDPNYTYSYDKYSCVRGFY